jgi:hypothetical protein
LSQVFPKLPTFSLMELSGKNLDIFTAKDGNITVLFGKDTKTGDVYVIAEDIKEDE